MSILAKFFQISLVLMIILMGINLSIVTVGYTMTGQDIGGNVGVTTIDLNAYNIDLNKMSVEQSDTESATSTIESSGWEDIVDGLYNLVYGYEKVFNFIFADIDPTTSEDVSEQIGRILVNIIQAFQTIGLVYGAFAIVAVLTGGGKP